MIWALGSHVTMLAAIETTNNVHKLCTLISSQPGILAIGLNLDRGGVMGRSSAPTRGSDIEHQIVDHSASGCGSGGLPHLHEGLVDVEGILLKLAEGHVGIGDLEGDQGDPDWILQTCLIRLADQHICTSLVGQESASLK